MISDAVYEISKDLAYFIIFFNLTETKKKRYPLTGNPAKHRVQGYWDQFSGVWQDFLHNKNQTVKI